MNTVELHTPEQGADLEALIVRQHAEIGGDRPLHMDACRRTMARVATDHGRYRLNCWLHYREDTLVGYLGAFISEPFYSNALYAHCDEWYVIPEARGTRAAFSLVMYFERWAKERGAFLAQMNVSHRLATDTTQQVLHLFERLGYKHTGYYATKQLERN